MKKGEIIEDVYYTMEKYSYLMADIDLSMSMRWERSALGFIASGDGEENPGGPFRADCNKWRKYDGTGTG